MVTSGREALMRGAREGAQVAQVAIAPRPFTFFVASCATVCLPRLRHDLRANASALRGNNRLRSRSPCARPPYS